MCTVKQAELQSFLLALAMIYRASTVALKMIAGLVAQVLCLSSRLKSLFKTRDPERWFSTNLLSQ